jgi:asparagine synthase (glutamine-hydrolysing)
MCGISGFVDFERVAAKAAWSPADLRLAEQLRDGMIHRGPDDAGQWQVPGVILSQRRLAILDLSPDGAQPMIAANGCALTFNGEIYNYVELRAELVALGRTFRSTGDTEVLLQALQTWGPDATLPKLRGMFAFAFWNPADRSLFLARDPIGKKPLYVWQRGRQLAFASSLWPLTGWLRVRGVALTVDPVAIEHHLAGGYIAAPRTVFQEVRKLRAGEAWRVDLLGPARRPIAPVPFAQPGQALDGATLDRLEFLLQRAVERRLRSDVPVATFLSGGIDSSLITALAAKLHPGITAYTVRTGDGQEDELAIARRVAAHTGVQHEVLEIGHAELELLPKLVRHYGEPFGDSSALPSWLIAERAGARHRVVLTGDGGDEVQGGYPRTQMFALRHLLHDVAHLPHLPLPSENPGLHGKAASLWFRGYRLLTPGALAISAQADGLHHLHTWFTPEVREALAKDGWQQLVQRTFASFATKNQLDRCLALEFRLYLPEDLNVKVDVAAMGHAVETRAPLLDRDFTDACWQVRARDRVRPWQTKRILRALLARHLPQDAQMQRKQGFSVPMARWMADSARQQQLAERLRAGLPGLPWFNGEAAAAGFLQRAQAGEDVGTLGFRLLWLAEWAEQNARLVAPQAP